MADKNRDSGPDTPSPRDDNPVVEIGDAVMDTIVDIGDAFFGGSSKKKNDDK